jgi:predicted nuclease with TOPRIM domain
MYKNINDYLKKMVDEYNDLQEKISKLIKFIQQQELMRDITTDALSDLKEQVIAMQQYKQALEKRLIKNNLIPKITWQN